MTSHFFEKLHLSTKLQIMFAEGQVVSDRNDYEHRITLYRLSSFFVEVYCDLNFTTIEEVRLISHPDQLIMSDSGAHVPLRHLLMSKNGA